MAQAAPTDDAATGPHAGDGDGGDGDDRDSTGDRYAVIGNPVAHSQSPFIHAAFARQAGHALRFDRVLCALGAGAFEQCLSDFAAGGGRGCSVTVPFKLDALRLAAACTPRARLAGAANALRRSVDVDGGGWHADNTDGSGLLRDIQHNAGFALAGRRVLLIGAGGAAAGVLGPLLQARPAAVVVCNRTAAKADALVARHAALAAEHGVALAAADIAAPGNAFDAVVNASASSLHAAAVPVPTAVLKRGTLAVDLMYGGAAAPFLAWADGGGAASRDGLGMLVEQAAESFIGWRGFRPDTAPVLQALRERLAPR